MRQHLQGVDHVVIAVNDIDASEKQYTQLGFTVTPRGYHTMGSVNHCVMFEHDYVELLAIPTEHPALNFYREYLKNGDGLVAIALMTDDANGLHHELTGAGIKSDAPLDFSRPVVLPEGTFDAAFRITQIDTVHTAAGRMFACQHFTRDVVWRPEYVSHANQVTGLTEVIVLSPEDELKDVATSYGTIFDAEVTSDRQFEQGYVVATGNVPVRFTTEAGFEACYPGLRTSTRTSSYYAALGFKTASIDAVRGVLKQNDIPFQMVNDHTVAVSACDANGVVIFFTA